MNWFQPISSDVWRKMYITVGLPHRDQDLPDPIKNPYALWVWDALEVAYDQVRRQYTQPGLDLILLCRWLDGCAVGVQLQPE